MKISKYTLYVNADSVYQTYRYQIDLSRDELEELLERANLRITDHSTLVYKKGDDKNEKDN